MMPMMIAERRQLLSWVRKRVRKLYTIRRQNADASGSREAATGLPNTGHSDLFEKSDRARFVIEPRHNSGIRSPRKQFKCEC